MMHASPNPTSSPDAYPDAAAAHDAPQLPSAYIHIKQSSDVVTYSEASDSAPMQAVQTPKELAEKYRFIRRLGIGSQACVYLAERLEDGQLTAIKQLRVDSIKTWKEYTLFHREAAVLAKLDIPGVVRSYEACDCLEADPPCSYIVQEYIEGATLKEILKSGYRFSLSQICDLMIKLLEIIQNLQENDPPVIHRDIKPSNIIMKLRDDGQFDVCLIDFGAVSNPQVQSGGSTIAGTYGYMSPEQNIGRAVPASDTYALGVLAAFLLSGVEPLEMTVKDLRLIIDPYIENHPTALVQTLRWMIEPDLKTRLSDIDELIKRFTYFKHGQFTLEDNAKNPLTGKQLIKRLNEVKYLCQPRNIEIWQALPETPYRRTTLPDPLFYTSPQFEHYPIYDMYGNGSIMDKIPMMISFCRVLITFIGIFAVLLLPMLYVTRQVESLTTFGYTGCTIYIIIALIITVYLFQKLTNIRETLPLFNSPKKRASNVPSIQNFHHKHPEHCAEHRSLYENGQKTIATITQISYISTKDNYINYQSGIDFGTEGNAKSNDFKAPRLELPPVFRIWYKFNPPDDDKAFDIIHWIDTHIDPKERIKVGDPLPILYTGYRATPSAPIHVTMSMPYPLPFHDLNTPDDYIGKTIILRY